MATLYADIREDLLAKIKTGFYQVGEVIPSEVELARSYGVSRPTIRQATQALVDEGHLEKRRRRGTIVCRPKITHRSTSQVTSFEDEMIANDRMPRTNVLILKRCEPSREVARDLRLKQGADVFKLVRLRFADGTPHEFSETYVPCLAYPSFDQFDYTKMRMYDVLREHGDPVVSAHRQLKVKKADLYSSVLLEVEEGEPLVILHSIGYNESGEPREYTTATYQGEGNVFDFDVRVRGA